MINLGDDFDKIQPLHAGEFSKLPAGGYVCITKHAEATFNRRNEPMLTLTLDIAEGDFKAFFKDSKYPPKLYQNILKDGKISPYFKGLLVDYENSNGGFVVKGTSFDEKLLINKFIGVVFGDEEREWQGKIYTDAKPKFTTSIAKIRADDFKIPELKKVDKTPNSSSDAKFDDEFDGNDIPDEKFPF